jgi:Fur family transcriptional regulator, peroxide stress response regulator
MQNSLKTDTLIIQALRSKGYKATPQRIAICKIALSSREHPSVQKIYLEVKKTHPTVSLATVYTTLHILKESGLVQELTFPQGQTRFDSYLEPHINLVCLRCGNIHDLDDLAAKELVKKVTAKAKFTPTAQRVDVYGICEHCSNVAKFG